MLEGILSWLGVGIVAVTATAILLSRDWRWNLGFMAAQYLGAAILASAHWPVGMASALMVTGWMSLATLGMTLTALPPHPDPTEASWPQGRLFRLFMTGIVFVLAVGLTPRIENFMAGIEAPVLAGSILLAGTGCLQLGTSSRIERIILGLLTFLTGFEVFYAAIEGSILVAAMLSVVLLGLGLIGAYLLNAPTPEDTA
jgi:hypothetical protein